jgi:hypothetical protein
VLAEIVFLDVYLDIVQTGSQIRRLVSIERSEVLMGVDRKEGDLPLG